MKTRIDIDTWQRKDHYLFFSKFDEPFFGVTLEVDCTIAYKKAKEKRVSFFLYYLYKSLEAANEVENFRYRIVDKEVYLFDKVNASPTINRPDHTFGFAYMDFYDSWQEFYPNAKKQIDMVHNSKGLTPAVSGENVIHYSSIPWINFTSISHARSYSFPDSSPKITFGKLTHKDGVSTMAVSIFLHHGLGDAYHISLFAERFQELLNQ